MALSTLTLTGCGRMPGCFGAGSLASAVLLINSGSVAVIPHATSAFSCYRISALGNYGIGNGRGAIGAPMNGGEQSGKITYNSSLEQFTTVSPMMIERTTGSTIVATGGGTQV